MENEMNSVLLDRLTKNAEDYWDGLYYHVIPQIINDNSYLKGIEIGVAFGGHAFSILDKTKLERLVCIDPWEFTGAEFEGLKSKSDFDDWYEYVIKRLCVFEERVDIIRSRSDDAHVLIENASQCFVFIDGEHSYSQVINDIINYLPKIRNGGMLIGHDYMHPDFMGVKDAVDEFVRDSGLLLELHHGYVWSIQL